METLRLVVDFGIQARQVLCTPHTHWHRVFGALRNSLELSEADILSLEHNGSRIVNEARPIKDHVLLPNKPDPGFDFITIMITGFSRTVPSPGKYPWCAGLSVFALTTELLADIKIKISVVVVIDTWCKTFSCTSKTSWRRIFRAIRVNYAIADSHELTLKYEGVKIEDDGKTVGDIVDILEEARPEGDTMIIEIMGSVHSQAETTGNNFFGFESWH